MRFAYQNSGHPILKWGMTAPSQTRAPVGSSLGSLDEPTLVLPRPGAPEPINGLGCSMGSTRTPRVMESDGGFRHPMAIGGPVMTSDGYFKNPEAMGGCGCTKCGGSGLSGIVDTISDLSMPAKIAGAVGLYLLYKKLKKK